MSADKQTRIPKLTPFGRELRKLRIDHSETLSDLAEVLGLSVAFLSAIETGRKNIPGEFLDQITAHYNLNHHEYTKLSRLIELSQREVKLSLDRKSDEVRSFVTQFARHFSELSDEERQKIKQVLDKYKG